MKQPETAIPTDMPVSWRPIYELLIQAERDFHSGRPPRGAVLVVWGHGGQVDRALGGEQKEILKHGFTEAAMWAWQRFMRPAPKRTARPKRPAVNRTRPRGEK